MASELPRLFLARHGDTAWTDSRQRTGRTDIPLNAVGEDRARQFGVRLRRFSFASVFTSPLSAPRGLANSPVLERSRRSMPTLSSGTTDATRGWCFGTFRKNGPPGNFSVTAAPEANPPKMSPPELIGSSHTSWASRGTFSHFRVDTSSE